MSAMQYLTAAIARPGRTLRRNVSRRRSPGSAAHQAILALDLLLRHLLGIFEYSDSPDCLLRIAVTRSASDRALPGAIAARKGQTLIELHLWNEHVTSSLAGRLHFGRAKVIVAEFRRSLEFLAQYLDAHPEIDESALVHARMPISSGDSMEKVEAFARIFGFCVTCTQPHGAARLHDYFEDFLIRWLVRAFNPARALKSAPHLQRAEFWMTRQALLERYAAPAPPKPARTAERRRARAASASSRA